VIRPFEERDAAAVATLLRRIQPHYVRTPEGLRHFVANEPERSHPLWLVAEEQGEIVGWAEAGVRWHLESDEVGDLWVAVAPEAEGRGIGGALYERAEAHVVGLGLREISSATEEGSRGERFSAERGYAVARRERISMVEPQTMDYPPLTADVLPLAEVRDRAEELYRLFWTIESTFPRQYQWTGYSLDEWLAETWSKPTLDDEMSVVALLDGRAVAASWLLVDWERRAAEVEVTGTLPEFRRRGLARACKVESLRRAAERGVARVYTDNDLENVGILALNESLGFRPVAIGLELTKRIGPR
jgi:ribosomal protein S18 acetylase RimI-like enzyme